MSHQLFRAIVAMVAASAVVACTNRAVDPAVASQPLDEELGRMRTAVVGALSSEPPRGYAAIPKSVRLLSITRRDDGAVVLDFSGELLAGGTGRVLEDSLHQIFTAASSARQPAAERVDDYTVLVNGISLDSYLR
jgi:hypothetical protein